MADEGDDMIGSLLRDDDITRQQSVIHNDDTSLLSSSVRTTVTDRVEDIPDVGGIPGSGEMPCEMSGISYYTVYMLESKEDGSSSSIDFETLLHMSDADTDSSSAIHLSDSSCSHNKANFCEKAASEVESSDGIDSFQYSCFNADDSLQYSLDTKKSRPSTVEGGSDADHMLIGSDVLCNSGGVSLMRPSVPRLSPNYSVGSRRPYKPVHSCLFCPWLFTRPESYLLHIRRCHPRSQQTAALKHCRSLCMSLTSRVNCREYRTSSRSRGKIMRSESRSDQLDISARYFQSCYSMDCVNVLSESGEQGSSLFSENNDASHRVVDANPDMFYINGESVDGLTVKQATVDSNQRSVEENAFDVRVSMDTTDVHETTVEDGGGEPYIGGLVEGKGSTPFIAEAADVIDTTEIIDINNEPYAANQSGEKKALVMCKICNKNFSLKSFFSHNRRVHGLGFRRAPKTYACAYCSRVFWYKNHLTNHEATHTRTKVVLCLMCNSVLQHLVSFKCHYEKCHERNLKHACVQCARVFWKAVELKKHVCCPSDREKNQAKNDLLVAKCRALTERWEGPTHVELFREEAEHIITLSKGDVRVCAEGEQITCILCRKQFRTLRYFQTHFRLSHLQQFELDCQHCGLAFYNRPQLMKHRCIPARRELNVKKREIRARHAVDRLSRATERLTNARALPSHYISCRNGRTTVHLSRAHQDERNTQAAPDPQILPELPPNVNATELNANSKDYEQCDSYVGSVVEGGCVFQLQSVCYGADVGQCHQVDLVSNDVVGMLSEGSDVVVVPMSDHQLDLANCDYLLEQGNAPPVRYNESSTDASQSVIVSQSASKPGHGEYQLAVDEFHLGSETDYHFCQDGMQIGRQCSGSSYSMLDHAGNGLSGGAEYQIMEEDTLRGISGESESDFYDNRSELDSMLYTADEAAVLRVGDSSMDEGLSGVDVVQLESTPKSEYSLGTDLLQLDTSRGEEQLQLSNGDSNPFDSSSQNLYPSLSGSGIPSDECYMSGVQPAADLPMISGARNSVRSCDGSLLGPEMSGSFSSKDSSVNSDFHSVVTGDCENKLQPVEKLFDQSSLNADGRAEFVDSRNHEPQFEMLNARPTECVLVCKPSDIQQQELSYENCSTLNHDHFFARDDSSSDELTQKRFTENEFVSSERERGGFESGDSFSEETEVKPEFWLDSLGSEMLNDENVNSIVVSSGSRYQLSSSNDCGTAGLSRCPSSSATVAESYSVVSLSAVRCAAAGDTAISCSSAVDPVAVNSLAAGEGRGTSCLSVCRITTSYSTGTATVAISLANSVVLPSCLSVSSDSKSFSAASFVYMAAGAPAATICTQTSLSVGSCVGAGLGSSYVGESVDQESYPVSETLGLMKKGSPNKLSDAGTERCFEDQAVDRIIRVEPVQSGSAASVLDDISADGVHGSMTLCLQVSCEDLKKKGKVTRCVTKRKVSSIDEEDSNMLDHLLSDCEKKRRRNSCRPDKDLAKKSLSSESNAERFISEELLDQLPVQISNLMTSKCLVSSAAAAAKNKNSIALDCVEHFGVDSSTSGLGKKNRKARLVVRRVSDASFSAVEKDCDGCGTAGWDQDVLRTEEECVPRALSKRDCDTGVTGLHSLSSSTAPLCRTRKSATNDVHDTSAKNLANNSSGKRQERCRPVVLSKSHVLKDESCLTKVNDVSCHSAPGNDEPSSCARDSQAAINISSSVTCNTVRSRPRGRQKSSPCHTDSDDLATADQSVQNLGDASSLRIDIMKDVDKLDCEGEVLRSVSLPGQATAPPEPGFTVCSVCGKAIKNRNYTPHMRRVHLISSNGRVPIEWMTCEQCGFRCQGNYKYRRHVMTHDSKGARSIQCELCDHACYEMSDYTHHFKRRHLSQFTIECDDCGRGFWKTIALRQHICFPELREDNLKMRKLKEEEAIAERDKIRAARAAAAIT